MPRQTDRQTGGQILFYKTFLVTARGSIIQTDAQISKKLLSLANVEKPVCCKLACYNIVKQF